MNTGLVSPAAGRLPVVLIVDDHEDTAAMYAIFLLAAGFQPVAAATADIAFERACAVRPDIIVADLILGDGSGLELTRRLRDDTRTRNLGIIVLTGHAIGSVRQEAIEAGCDRFLLKPCLPDVLAMEIMHVLAERKRPQEDAVGTHGQTRTVSRPKSPSMIKPAI
jgi:two-component system, cell cycle response regulator DivK